MKLDEPHTPLDRWVLDPAVEHVNHGSFGGCPTAVIDAASEWRERLEAAPMRFLVLDWQDAIDAARGALAEFLRAPAERLAFVPNATTGVAIALASLHLDAGDEIVITDHEYRAVKHQVLRLAAARGARIVVATLPLPFDADAGVASIAGAVTPRTRLVVLDHITSPTALVLPIERIVAALGGRDIAVIVDGAHAPGQLPLDVGALLAGGVTWYAGNNHKWLCAAKGTGFLAGSERAPALRPIVTSHGAAADYGPSNRYHAELDWMGTYDPSAHLSVPTAIATIAELGNGWRHVIARNHQLALAMRDRLAAAIGSTPFAPDDATGTMAALPVTLPANTKALDLEKQLLRDGLELPVIDFLGGLVRVSAHLYNHVGQADVVAQKLLALGIRGRELGTDTTSQLGAPRPKL